MQKDNLAPPSGSRDFLPQELAFRESVLTKVKQVFAGHGFQPLDTPAFERLEVLSGKYGEEGEKLIFKILKRGDKAQSGEADLALRYDLTVPTMRVYAHRRAELPRIFKRYQIGPVWRADRPGRGRFREFYQCDVDIIGTASRLADVEVLLALSAALQAVGLPRFRIRLNSRHVLKAMMTAHAVPADKQHAVIGALDKFDKIGLAGVGEELGGLDLPAEVAESLQSDLVGGEVEGRLRRRLRESEVGQRGLTEVDQIIAWLRPLIGLADIFFDPILARGLDYYTGPIFEFFAEGLPSSIAAGGRYDNLAGLFMKESVPVCGGSLGIERIMVILQAQGAVAPTPAPTAYVTLWDEAAPEDSLSLAQSLRRAGVAAEIDLAGGALSRQFKAANARGCRFVLVRGPDEVEAGTVQIKDMRSGAQSAVALADAADAIIAALGAA